MKKKLLSFAMACLMVASVLCTALPVFASDAITVNTGKELAEAAAAVQSGETKTIKIGSDFSLANNSSSGGINESINVAAGAKVIVEGQNHTIAVNTDLANATGDLTLKDLTLNLTTPMIGSSKGGALVYENCTITQTGGRSANNKFATINANGGSITMNNSSLTISNGTRNDSNSNVTVFKLEGAVEGTINLNNSQIKLADNAQFVDNLYAFYDSDGGSTLNINMNNSTIAMKTRVMKSAGTVNLDMKGASALSTAIDKNVIEALGGAGVFTLTMSGTSQIFGAENATTNVLQLDQAKSIAITMSDDAKLTNNGSGSVLVGHNGYDKSGRTLAITMSGNAQMLSKAGHTVNVTDEAYEKIPATTIAMSGASKIETQASDKYALNIGAAAEFTLTQNDTASVIKNGVAGNDAIYKIAPPVVDDPTGGKLCKINDTYYATLQAAVAAANVGDTIVLEANATVANTLEINKNITIEGSGKTITSNGGDGFVKLNAALTLNNATVTTENALGAQRALFVFVSNTGKIVMSDVTIELTNDKCDPNSAMFSDENAVPGVKLDISLNNVKVDTMETAYQARFIAGNNGGNVTLSGTTEIKMGGKDCGSTIINIGARTNPINFTMEDTASITAKAGNQVLYVHCKVVDAKNELVTGTRQPFNLTMSDDAKIVQEKSGKNGVGLNNAYATSVKANIVLTDNARIEGKGFGIRVYDTEMKLTMLDNSAVEGEAQDIEFGAPDLAASQCEIVNFTSDDLTLGGTDNCYSPTMAEKPSMRINGSSYGLRFTSTYRKDRSSNVKVAFGTLITKAETVANAEFSKTALTAANAKFLDIVAVDGIELGTEGSFNAAMVDIKEANYNVVFAARSYAEYSFVSERLKNVKVICYSDICTGTFADAALEQLADVKDASEVGYRNEVASYPVLANDAYTWTDGKKYSKLVAEQYTAISAIAGKK